MELGKFFWAGDIDAAYRALLAPSGIALEALREAPKGIPAPLETRYRRFAEISSGAPRGFNTPSRRIELFSETRLDHGYPLLPDYEEQLVSHRSEPQCVPRYPLILTCTRDALYCESQHRGLPSLHRRATGPSLIPTPMPRQRGTSGPAWIRIETP